MDDTRCGRLRPIQPFLVPLALLGILCIASALLVSALGALVSCNGKPKTPDAGPVVVPHTEFPPPTTVPSVTPAADTVSQQAGLVQGKAADIYPKVVALTPQNVEAQKPAVLTDYRGLLGEIQRLLGFSVQAQAQSRSNDAAVARLTAEVAGARSIVVIREQQLEEAHVAYAKAAADREAQWQKQFKAQADQLAAMRNDAEARDRNMLRWMWGTAVGVGGLLILAGGLILFFLPARKTVGVVVAGAGGLAICLGMAGLYFGREIAVAGLALGAVAILGAVWAVAHYLRQEFREQKLRDEVEKQRLRAAGVEIADGVQQAILAGKINKADVTPFLDQAQGPLARRLVDEATKDPAALAEEPCEQPN